MRKTIHIGNNARININKKEDHITLKTPIFQNRDKDTHLQIEAAGTWTFKTNNTSTIQNKPKTSWLFVSVYIFFTVISILICILGFIIMVLEFHNGNAFGYGLLGCIGLVFSIRFIYHSRYICRTKIVPFFYQDEINAAKAVLAKEDNKIKKEILSSYCRCLELSEQIDDIECAIVSLQTKENKKSKERLVLCKNKLESLQSELELAKYHGDSNLTEQQKQEYEEVCKAFDRAATCGKIFTIESNGTLCDITTSRGGFDFIKSQYATPKFTYFLKNNKGYDVYIYPNFILKAYSNLRFEIWDIKEANFAMHQDNIPFQDEDTPKDAVVVKTTFLHKTKDGTMDLRYSYNPRFNECQICCLLWGDKLMDIQSVIFSNTLKANHLIHTLQIFNGKLTNDTNKITKSPRTIKEILQSGEIKNNNFDPLIEDVIEYVIATQNISLTDIQTHFEVGCNRATKIAEQLELLRVWTLNGDNYRIVPSIESWEQELTTKGVATITSPITDITAKKGIAPQDTHTSPIEQLNALVGLQSVKQEIEELTNYIHISQERKKNGLKSVPISYHCVFTGNPGTGKTTVARILANIYKDLGILKKGHLIETDRSGLVAEYVGQTAVKTNKIIDSALDGVLFIDEAYTLANDSQSDYGKEAIATLLKRMEDDRDRLVVIVAGYTDEIMQFIHTNPGLESRFNHYINFPDYTTDELIAIFHSYLKQYEYKLTDSAQTQLQQIFESVTTHKTINFGNARFVRNFYEETIKNQANRLSKEGNLSADKLNTIEQQDLAIEIIH